MVTYIDRPNSSPLFVVYGSSQAKKSDCIKVGWIRGNWKEEWICEKGHSNIYG
jgi:hypothetical protein